MRRSLPLGVDIADPAQLSSDLVATVTALAEQLQVVSASDVARGDGASVRGSSPCPVGPLAQAQALEQLMSTLCLTQISATRHDPGRRGAGGARASGRKPDVRRDGERGADGVLAGDPVRVGDLPGPADHESLELVERLMRAGVVVAVEQDIEAPA